MREDDMTFDSMISLERVGFTGFVQVDKLIMNLDEVTEERGIYIVLYIGAGMPEFLEQGTGGWFNGRDPNMNADELIKRWVHDAPVIYIGKTNRPLRDRVEELLRFGSGWDIGHYGGRLIWQIHDRDNLILCWKGYGSDSRESREIEKKMILRFEAIYGKMPFANIKH